MYPRMNDPARNPAWLILADTRCSAALRELCRSQHWPVLEYSDDHAAARTVVAMGAARVAVEAGRAVATVPTAARILAALDTTERVVCIGPDPDPRAEREAAACGVVLCQSVERFAEHLGLLCPHPMPGLTRRPSRTQPTPRGAVNR